MKTKILSLFIFLCAFPQLASAQTLSLTPEEKQEFTIRITQMLDEFLSQLGYIASKESTERTKDVATKAALNLFIGKGHEYYTTDIQTGQKKRHLPVTMQTSSKRRGKNPPQRMTSYLKSLRNMIYSKVIIESAGAVRVDNIFKTGDGEYEAMAYFCQDFYGYKDNKITYSDTTDKAVKVYIKAIESPEVGGVIWCAYLGDISVVSTR